MEGKIIEYLKSLLSAYKEDPEWIKFGEYLQNQEFSEGLFNIIRNPDYGTSRILALSALKQFVVQIPNQAIELFLPLLNDNDSRIQSLIAYLIARSSDSTYLSETAFPLLISQIQNPEEQVNLIKGIILCAYEYVKRCKARNQNILEFLVKTSLVNTNIPIKIRKMALEAIIRQIQYCFYKDETSPIFQNDFNSFLALFNSIPIDDDNLPLFEYMLTFISSHQNLVSVEIVQKKLEELFRIFVDKECPLRHDDYIKSTVLYTLIEVIFRFRIPIPFPMIFRMLTYHNDHLMNIGNNINDFFAGFIIESDNNIECENDTEKEEEVSDYIEYKIQNLFDQACSINDVHYIIRMHTSNMHSPEYINDVICFCYEIINRSPNENLAIIQLFKSLPLTIPIIFDPTAFNCYENYVLSYSLLSFCFKRIPNGRDEEKPFLLFAMNNFKSFAEVCLANDVNPTLILSIFDLTSNAPRGFISQANQTIEIYSDSLKKTIGIVLNTLSNIDDRIELVKKIREYLYYFEDENKCNIMLEENNAVKRLASKSVFKLPIPIIEAFKKDSFNFFGFLKMSLSENKSYFDVFYRLCKICRFFAGGNICHLINRNVGQPLVNINEYNLFFPEVCQCVLEVFNEFPFDNKDFEEDQLSVNCCFALLSYALCNIQCQDNPDYLSLIDKIYQLFCKVYPKKIIESKLLEPTLRVFIKNGKIDKLVEICDFFINHSDVILINDFQYELAFILMNGNIYSLQCIQNLSKSLLLLFVKDVESKISESVLIVFARVALFNKELYQMLLGPNYIPFLKKAYNNIVKKFKGLNESEQRIIFAFFALFSEDDQIRPRIQLLLVKMVEYLNDVFDESETFVNPTSITSARSFFLEDLFYDDQQYLLHPLISSSVCQLIQDIMAGVEKPELLRYLENFINKYPYL